VQPGGGERRAGVTSSPSYSPMILISSSLGKPGLESTLWPRARNWSAQILSVASLSKIFARLLG
jgi:hypothetical protein